MVWSWGKDEGHVLPPSADHGRVSATCIQRSVSKGSEHKGLRYECGPLSSCIIDESRRGGCFCILGRAWVKRISPRRRECHAKQRVGPRASAQQCLHAGRLSDLLTHAYLSGNGGSVEAGPFPTGQIWVLAAFFGLGGGSVKRPCRD